MCSSGDSRSRGREVTFLLYGVDKSTVERRERERDDRRKLRRINAT